MGEGSRKSTRKRVNNSQNTDWSKVSSAHYVGYVEDGESIEAIMKKFQELEKFQEEALNKKTKINSETKEEESEEETYGLASFLEPEPKKKTNNLQPKVDNTELLTQEQLEELFIRTSAFTLESAADQPDANEWWRLDDEFVFEVDEDEEYMDYGDDEWEEEISSKGRRSKTGIRRQKGRNKDRASQRELIMRRYREMHLQDASGNMLAMLKKVQLTDPSLPTYIKIPPEPLPLSWARRITPLEENDNGGRNNFNFNILNNFNQIKNLGNNFQAILIDPPLLLDDEEIDENEIYPPYRQPIRMKEFKTLPIPQLIHTGFLMIWIEKHHLDIILKLCIEQWKFRYVENVAWVHYDINNRIKNIPSKLAKVNQIDNNNQGYFQSAKSTLLIFRIGDEIDIRHQRSPDVIFDQIRPIYDADDNSYSDTCLNRPKFIYDLIETLIPKPSNSNEDYRFLELWAPPSRKKIANAPWISIVNEDEDEVEEW